MTAAGTGASRWAGPGTAALAVLSLCASTPPAWFPGAFLLAPVGLGALFLVATRSNRPYRWGYAVGLVHLLWFSWSLRHVTWPGYVAIAVLGAVYTVLVVAWTRAFLGRGLAPLGFALGVAATSWLRAHAPEISYPHGQPAHALYPWPALLGPARLGGEVLVNLLLAALSAGLARALVVPPARRSGVVTAAVAAAAWGLTALVPATPPGPSGAPATLRVAAVQSDFPIRFERAGEGFAALVEETSRLARATIPVELVLWPESTWPARLTGATPTLERRLLPPIPAGARLCAGTMWRAPDGRRAVAVLLEPDGALAGFQEKRVSVPAGERLPFVHWLPDGLGAWVLDSVRGVIGFVPDQLDGRRRPPLRTPSGVPFAAMTCFDNAFSWVAREAVEDGARLLCVLSNESWYVQGGELDQMVAMTVFRALETRTPVVRSTVDGVTCAVGADGRILETLPRRPGAGPATLRLEVALGPGSLGPIAAVLPVLTGLSLLSGGLVILHLGRAWRRRRNRGSGSGTDRDRALDPS